MWLTHFGLRDPMCVSLLYLRLNVVDSCRRLYLATRGIFCNVHKYTPCSFGFVFPLVSTQDLFIQRFSLFGFIFFVAFLFAASN